MTNRPRLYPGHQHQWADTLIPGPQLVCQICGIQMPRNVVEAFDTIHAEVASLRAEITEVQPVHHPRCNPECDGDTHMLLADDQPEQEPA